MKQVLGEVPGGPPSHPFLSQVIRVGDLIFVPGNAALIPRDLNSWSRSSALPTSLLRSSGQETHSP